MNIVLRELYANKKSLIIWSLSIIAFIVMMFVEFSAYYKNPEMLAVIDAMPKEMLEAFGMADANLTTVSGYLKVAIIFINITLCAYALLLGNGIIAKEERDKTAGFLMTLPVTRIHIISGKLISAVICCAILLLVVTASIVACVLPYETEEYFEVFLALVMLTTFIIMLIFLSIGMLLAALTRRHKISGGIGVGLLFAMYLASIIAGLSENMEFLKYVSPFMYFDPSIILRDLTIDPAFAMLSAAIVLCALLTAFKIYEGRDLYV